LPRSLLLVPAALSLACVSLLAQSNAKDPEPSLPKVFDKAQYVYVQALSGDRTSRGVTTEDLQAIYNVERELKAWGRYTLTLSRENADLVFVVHKSRVNDNHTPVIVPTGPRQPGRAPRDPSDPSDPTNTQSGPPGLGAEVGSPDDQLSVYIPAGSVSSMTGPIWNDSSRNGLSAPRLPLFQELKQDVEEAYPR
jgi:hypothetical protein